MGHHYFLKSELFTILHSFYIFSLRIGSLGVRVLRIFRVLSTGRGGGLHLIVGIFDPSSPEEDEGGDGGDPDGDEDGDDEDGDDEVGDDEVDVDMFEAAS